MIKFEGHESMERLGTPVLFITQQHAIVPAIIGLLEVHLSSLEIDHLPESCAYNFQVNSCCSPSSPIRELLLRKRTSYVSEPSKMT